MKGLYTVIYVYSILFGYTHTAPAHNSETYHQKNLQNTHFYQRREKRSLLDASTYSRSSSEVASSIYDNLYNIVNGKC